MTKFKTVLDRSGMKQNDFAEQMGVTPQSVTHWLRDGIPARRMFEAAKVLNVPIVDIFEGEIGPELSDMLDGLKIESLNSAKDFVNLFFDKLHSFPIEELNKLSGHIDNIAETKKRSK